MINTDLEFEYHQERAYLAAEQEWRENIEMRELFQKQGEVVKITVQGPKLKDNVEYISRSVQRNT